MEREGYDPCVGRHCACGSWHRLWGGDDKAQFHELQRDAKRLDWLENGALGAVRRAALWLEHDQNATVSESRSMNRPLREVIDEAMAASGHSREIFDSHI